MASYISRIWVIKRPTLHPKSLATILIVRGSQRSIDSSGNRRMTAWNFAVRTSDCGLPVVVGSSHVALNVVLNLATETVSSDNYRALLSRRSISNPAEVLAPLREAMGNIVFRLRPEFEEERMYELDRKNYLARGVCRSAGLGGNINPGTGCSGFRDQSRRQHSQVQRKGVGTHCGHLRQVGRQHHIYLS